jgi:hypothetical protein
MVIWYIFSHFGMSQQENSGNPEEKPKFSLESLFSGKVEQTERPENQHFPNFI